MTQDEIIRMAWKTGLVIDGNFSGNDDLFAFAKLVAAHEREEIAKLADASVNSDQYPTLTMLAQAIRMRGD